jgi:hypothetical protein
MVNKIRRQNCLDQFQTFPLQSYDYKKDEQSFFYPAVFKSYILSLPSKSFKGLAVALGKEMVKLVKALHTDKLIFLGDTETPWLYQDNHYKPVKAAQEYLTFQKIGKHFNGALQVDAAELPTFIKHLTWLTRCNAALANVHFIDQKQSIVGSICKYGNLHLDTLNDRADKILKTFMNSTKFEYGDKNICYNRFVKTSAISGRQIVV